MKRRSDITPDVVVMHLKTGMTTTEIAAKLSCSRSFVVTKANKGGWNFSRGGHRETSGRKKTKKNAYSGRICTCCNMRHVPNKPIRGVYLTRLCAECYINANERGEIF